MPNTLQYIWRLWGILGLNPLYPGRQGGLLPDACHKAFGPAVLSAHLATARGSLEDDQEEKWSSSSRYDP